VPTLFQGIRREPTHYQNMIRHTVVFNLKHAPESGEAKRFLDATLGLQDIPGVTCFERLRQTSGKAPFAFGLSMEFADQEAYQLYCDHPIHSTFVEAWWIPQVADFMEIDYRPY
jgi:hypothetical protein